MPLLLSGPAHPVTLPEPEAALARQSSEVLARFIDFVNGDNGDNGDNGAPARARGAASALLSLRLTDHKTGATIEADVPAVAVRLLAEVLARLAGGQAVTLLPRHTELSTQQAADLLGVSRPYFVKLLEQGKLPHRKVGAQRRVRYGHLLRYLERERQGANQALDELVALSEEMGLYQMEQSGVLKNRAVAEAEENATNAADHGAGRGRS
jgi:excisionase family DNA binding protein